ncbi:hypothetical protein Hanom_Chr01g00086771 [Helianthus anomalus]
MIKNLQYITFEGISRWNLKKRLEAAHKFSKSMVLNHNKWILVNNYHLGEICS